MSERTAEQLKYLELVQANIARMHDASTSMKRFALVAFALGGSLARYLQDTTILGLMVVVIAAFWVLDSKYPQVEHGYRSLFEIVRAQPTGDEASFDLTPTRYRHTPSGAVELVNIRLVRSLDPSPGCGVDLRGLGSLEARRNQE